MHPVVRRTIAGAGAACLALSAVCFATEGAVRAAPLLGVTLRLPFFEARRPASPVAAAPSPSPSPTVASLAIAEPATAPAPARKRHARFLGEGPIVLQGDGTYQLAFSRSTRDSLATGYNNYSTALTLSAQRRTEQTSLVMSSVFGYGAQGISTGGLIVGYNTPKYGLTYGAVAGPGDTQLQIGGFARGVGLTIPLRGGDIALLSSTTTVQSDTYRIYGLRRTWDAFGGFVALAVYNGSDESSAGREHITDLSYHRFGARLSTDTELAVSTTRNVAGISDGSRFAGAFRADLQGGSSFATLSLRDVPTGLNTLTGILDGGFQGDLALHRHSDFLGDVSLDLGHIDDSASGLVSHDNHLILSGGKTWKILGVQYTSQLDQMREGGASTITRSDALAFNQNVGKLNLFQTFQVSAVTGGNGNARQQQVAVGAAREMLGGMVAAQFTRNNSTGDGALASFGNVEQLTYRRRVGRKLDLQLSQAEQTQTTSGITARVLDTAVTLIRRLSPVLSLQAGIDRFHQTGLGAGSGNTVNVSLIGPFGFGPPQIGYQGKANPHLPAVIRGVVSIAGATGTVAYRAQAQRPLANALVVLDGGQSERTDSTGSFEFRFVQAGPHSVRLDPATVPGGLIPDREVQTVNAQGGMIATVTFDVGNFAGVSGAVQVQETDGKLHPLGGIGVAVDGIQAAVTAPDGRYSLGRLSIGPHTVSVVDATLPSTLALTGDAKRTVNVAAGTTVHVDFTAAGLGKITGQVEAPGDGGFGSLVGLQNVYIVAQPGEHAVITDETGTFVLDNLPAGRYTLTVDPDTIPDGLSVLSGPDGPIDVVPAAAVSGVIFKLGEGAKNVVFTFNNGKKGAVTVSVLPTAAAPGALVHVTARTQKDVHALAVQSDVFGNFPLAFDKQSATWNGAVVVPHLQKGDYAMTVTANRPDVADGEALVAVDPAMPLFSLRFSPLHPQPGATMRVALRAFAPVAEGDVVTFEDGYHVKLPKPRGGVFGFDIRLWRKGLPYNATITTKKGDSFPLSVR